MTIIFLILIIIASVILGLIVLIQNPKGGGLAGNIAGFSTQFMGVKQTTDILEKGTWLFAGIIGVLCLASSFFIPKNATTNTQQQQQQQQQQPQQQQPQPQPQVPSPGPRPMPNNTVSFNQ